MSSECFRVGPIGRLEAPLELALEIGGQDVLAHGFAEDTHVGFADLYRDSAIQASLVALAAPSVRQNSRFSCFFARLIVSLQQNKKNMKTKTLFPKFRSTLV